MQLFKTGIHDVCVERTYEGYVLLHISHTETYSNFDIYYDL